MAQHDYVIANGTGAAVRSDLNNGLAAIVSNNSGATEPGTMYAYQWWPDTTTGLLKIRNAANNAWVTVGTLASANLGLLSLAGGTMTGALAVTAGTAALPGIAVSGDLNTGITSPGADQLAISTGGTSRLAVSTTAVSSTLAVDVPLGAVGTPSITFTGDLNTGLFSPGADTLALVTGGTNRVHVTSGGLVGIGTPSPSVKFHVSGARAIINDGTGTETGLSIGTDSTSTGTSYGAIDLNGATYAGIHLRTGNVVRASLFQTTVSTSLETNTNIPLTFGTNSTERARIDSSGRLLVGTSTARSTIGFDNTPQLQIEGTNASNSAASIVSNANNAGAPHLYLAKSRGGSVGSNTIVQSGDGLGFIQWSGNDGSQFEVAAQIGCEVDGTPGANDMPGRLVFSTTADGAASPTERMRINSSGQILYGTTTKNITSPNNPGFEIHSQATGGLGLYSNTTGDNVTAVVFQNPNGRVGFIDINANSVTYNTSSDYRLKENVTAVTDGITRLQQLKPTRFNFITNPDQTVDGFLAHEVQAIVPEAITGEKDAVDEEGNPKYQGIDQSKLVPLLTAALQEAIARIETLETRLSALEAA